MRLAKATLIWAALAAAICVPIALRRRAHCSHGAARSTFWLDSQGLSHWVLRSFSLC